MSPKTEHNGILLTSVKTLYPLKIKPTHVNAAGNIRGITRKEACFHSPEVAKNLSSILYCCKTHEQKKFPTLFLCVTCVLEVHYLKTDNN